jgi:hypothetical protein
MQVLPPSTNWQHRVRLPVIAGIPSTDQLIRGWAVWTGIPASSTIVSMDSDTPVHLAECHRYEHRGADQAGGTFNNDAAL